MDGWNTSLSCFLLGPGLFSGALAVSFSEGNSSLLKIGRAFQPNPTQKEAALPLPFVTSIFSGASFGSWFVQIWCLWARLPGWKSAQHTRWAPTSYKWSYNPYKWPYKPYKWPYKRVNGVITLLITGRGPPCTEIHQKKLLAFFVGWMGGVSFFFR